ncbi:MAG: hypothetical protein MZU97_10010 [Bacillus subtilis]|nr:hypothetical protein [Bacillus subtilis]
MMTLVMLSLVACDFLSTTATTASTTTTTLYRHGFDHDDVNVRTDHFDHYDDDGRSDYHDHHNHDYHNDDHAPQPRPQPRRRRRPQPPRQPTNGSTPLIPSGYSLLQDELGVVGMPATGNVKVLVFAVDFPDYPAATRGVTIADIQQAFNGSSSSMAFESLQSYYDKSSYGKLHISADVYGYYRAPQNSDYYADLYETEYPDSDLIYDLLEYLRRSRSITPTTTPTTTASSTAFTSSTRRRSATTRESDLWWAYMDSYIYEGDIFDGVEPYYFVWHGTDFFLGRRRSVKRPHA